MSVKSESGWGLKRAPEMIKKFTTFEEAQAHWLSEAKAKNDAAPEGVHQFETGAVRSKDADGAAYELISPIGLRRLAETYQEGATKYTPFNYEKGMGIGVCLRHAIRHIFLYLRGDRKEDHLAHAAWNLFTAMHSEELWPELNKDLRRDDCVPPNVTDGGALCWGVPSAD